VCRHSAELDKVLNEQSADEQLEFGKIHKAQSQEQRAKLSENVRAQLVCNYNTIWDSTLLACIQR